MLLQQWREEGQDRPLPAEGATSEKLEAEAARRLGVTDYAGLTPENPSLLGLQSGLRRTPIPCCFHRKPWP